MTTHLLTHTDTANVQSYTSAAFTPATNDLLFVWVFAPATVAAGGMSGSTGLTFTKVDSETRGVGADTLYLFVADSLATNVSQTVTFTCTGDAATGVLLFVGAEQGMTKTGATAVLQSAGTSNQASGSAPSVTLGAATQAGNTVIGFMANATGPPAQTPPAGTTEAAEGNFASPTSGGEWWYGTGLTQATFTWGTNSGNQSGSIVAELDLSGAGGTLNADASQTVTASLTGTGASTKPVDASRTVTAAPTATASASKDIAATLAVTQAGTATAASTKPVDAALAVTDTISATATIGAGALSADASLTGTATVTATASVAKGVTAALTVTEAGSAAASKTVSATATLTLTGTGSGSASAVKGFSASVAVTATTSATGSVTGVVVVEIAASLTVTASPSSVAARTIGAVAALAAALAAEVVASAQPLTTPGQMYPREAASATMRPATATGPRMDPLPASVAQTLPRTLATATMKGG